MRDFISKDPSFVGLSKQIKKIQKELQSTQKKADNRVIKLLAERLKIAVSAHKWKIVNREEYSQYNNPAGDGYYEIYLSRVPVEKSTGTPSFGSPPSAAFPSKTVSVAIGSRALNNKTFRKKKRKATFHNPKEIKSYDDLIYFGERWDISHLKRGKCLIGLRFDYLIISSHFGMEEVFQAIKELEVTLDFSHHIQDIEKSEKELELKKSLSKHLSSKMLFAV